MPFFASNNYQQWAWSDYHLVNYNPAIDITTFVHRRMQNCIYKPHPPENVLIYHLRKLTTTTPYTYVCMQP